MKKISLRPLNFETLEVSKNPGKFAEPVLANISPITDASMVTYGNDLIYKLQISAEEASSISISFDRMIQQLSIQLEYIRNIFKLCRGFGYYAYPAKEWYF